MLIVRRKFNGTRDLKYCINTRNFKNAMDTKNTKYKNYIYKIFSIYAKNSKHNQNTVCDVSIPLLKKESYRTDIIDDDILYKDSDVCILKPHIKKGIIVYSNYNNVNACIEGLKSGEQLHKEGIDFGRIVYHPYIFFRAPFFSDGIDYSTPENEVYSSYGKLNTTDCAYIRIDPSQTYVYSSEIRARIDFREPNYKQHLLNSRKSVLDYLSIISKNKQMLSKLQDRHIPVYNLYSSEIQFSIPFSTNIDMKFPLDLNPIEMNSEILVRLGHMPKDFFVMCYYH